MSAVRQHCEGNCGACSAVVATEIGASKALMGQMAQQYADYVVLTDDNPRS
ncbi:MAG: hypothetical protein R3E08_09050 [Thiotrichaceae bacterium]